ncbi:hypothetical protein ACTXT7_007576 [Hymenolepis weldensis]
MRLISQTRESSQMRTGPDIQMLGASRQRRQRAPSFHLRRFCCIGSHRDRTNRITHHIYRRKNERKTCDSWAVRMRRFHSQKILRSGLDVFQSVEAAVDDEVLSLPSEVESRITDVGNRWLAALLDDIAIFERVQNNTATESKFAAINQIRAEISDSTAIRRPPETTNEEIINVEKNFEMMNIND